MNEPTRYPDVSLVSATSAGHEVESDSVVRAAGERAGDDQGAALPASDEVRIKGSVRLSVREAIRQPYSEEAVFETGRTLPSVRPLLLQEVHPIANAPLKPKDLSRLSGSLTQRDQIILMALHAYRYLNLRQLELLFFPSSRSAQIRLKYLKDQGLVHRWKVIEPPGITRRPSLFLLTPRGARVLASTRGEDPRQLVRQAVLAQRHCLNFVHDLEANGFFVELAAASRRLPDQGLYHWVGELETRIHYREGKRRDRIAAAPASDGWGRYVTPSGDIYFDLEWDRGTESLRRLEQKIRSYTAYFKDRREAELHQVLFVVPRVSREAVLLERIAAEFPMFSRSNCRFWVTCRQYLDSHGPLGRIWLYARARKEPVASRDAGWQVPEPKQRLSILELPAHAHEPRDVRSCVAKPGWWNFRPGGADGP